MTRQQLEPEAGSDFPLHVKYRPADFEDVMGQAAILKSLAKAIASASRPHAYLFTGQSGCGKTTLARIVAKEVGVDPSNVLEFDAATNTGIDAVKAIIDTLKYKGFGDKADKMVIIDECHALSKAAWQALLKVLEEPPAHVYFCLCTTEPGKVPPTIVTRCSSYTVRSLSRDEMFDLLWQVNKVEGLRVPEDIIDQVIKVADGSPRKGLVGLSMVAGCTDAKEAAVLLAQPFETEDIIELCRAMVGGPKLQWAQVIAVLGPLKDEDPEGLRLVIVNYLTAVLIKSNAKQAPNLLDMLAQFMKPINRSEKMAPLLLAFGNICL